MREKVSPIAGTCWITRNLRFEGAELKIGETNVTSDKTFSPYGALTSGNSYTEPRNNITTTLTMAPTITTVQLQPKPSVMTPLKPMPPKTFVLLARNSQLKFSLTPPPTIRFPLYRRFRSRRNLQKWLARRCR